MILSLLRGPTGIEVVRTLMAPNASTIIHSGIDGRRSDSSVRSLLIDQLFNEVLRGGLPIAPTCQAAEGTCMLL